MYLFIYFVYEFVFIQFFRFSRVLSHSQIFRRLNDLIRNHAIVGGATALVLAITDENIFVANAGMNDRLER
jgi:hypothetical protein